MVIVMLLLALFSGLCLLAVGPLLMQGRQEAMLFLLILVTQMVPLRAIVGFVTVLKKNRQVSLTAVLLLLFETAILALLVVLPFLSREAFLIFLLLYGASQVVLDSTRYDSLFFRSNGFVSVVQVLGALGLGLAIFAFSRRMVKNWGLKFWQFLLWIPIAAGIGCGGFMEYYVQRHGNEAAFAYSVMSGCLVGVILLTLLIRYLAEKKEQKLAYSE